MNGEYIMYWVLCFISQLLQKWNFQIIDTEYIPIVYNDYKT